MIRTDEQRLLDPQSDTAARVREEAGDMLVAVPRPVRVVGPRAGLATRQTARRATPPADRSSPVSAPGYRVSTKAVSQRRTKPTDPEPADFIEQVCGRYGGQTSFARISRFSEASGWLMTAPRVRRRACRAKRGAGASAPLSD